MVGKGEIAPFLNIFRQSYAHIFLILLNFQKPISTFLLTLVTYSPLLILKDTLELSFYYLFNLILPLSNKTPSSFGEMGKFPYSELLKISKKPYMAFYDSLHIRLLYPSHLPKRHCETATLESSFGPNQKTKEALSQSHLGRIGPPVAGWKSHL